MTQSERSQERQTGIYYYTTDRVGPDRSIASQSNSFIQNEDRSLAIPAGQCPTPILAVTHSSRTRPTMAHAPWYLHNKTPG